MCLPPLLFDDSECSAMASIFNPGLADFETDQMFSNRKYVTSLR